MIFYLILLFLLLFLCEDYDIFFHCNISHLFWLCSPVQLNSYELSGPDFLSSWERFCNRIRCRDKEDEITQEFSFGLWRLWKHRNVVMFNGMHSRPEELLDIWRKNISNYRDATYKGPSEEHSSSEPVTTTEARVDGQWRKPNFGFYKINTDAAWCKSSIRMGVGWVCRDFAGLLHASGGSGIGLGHSNAAVEAAAIRDAIMACSTFGFNKVIIESDAKSIIQMLRKETPIDYSLESILSDIKFLAQNLTGVSFVFVSRKCNLAAHSVAKYALKEGQVFECDCIGQEFLFNILAQEVNIHIRI